MSSPDTELAVDLELFGRALDRLRDALSAHHADSDNSYIRDSVVKRYEFTYELAVRSLSRYLQASAFSSIEVEDLTFQGIIRRGDKAELLLSGWPEWKRFREARNQTARTYSEAKATAVIETAETFVSEANHLFEKLTERMTRNG
jgi:nucleotidyltransferase substrate binding protein (TIGR01987 family)